MPIVIREIHAPSAADTLNEEWFVLENTGEKPFSTQGLSVAVGKGPKARLRQVGTLDPGFTLAPSQRVRVISGNPGKKAHGRAPDEQDDVKNYHLFLGVPLLSGAGTVVAMAMRQHELARATFDPKAKDGVAPTKNGA